MDSPNPDAPQHGLEKYRRLDAFLERLKGDVYPEPPSDLHTRLSEKMFAQLQTVHPQAPGARVLDIGCGQGVALEIFRRAGLEAVGVTLGPDAEVCRSQGFDVVEADFTFLDFADRSFDLVWCRHALEHSVMPFFLIDEMHRVLKPGGVLYLEVPAPDTGCNHQRNPNHYSVLGKSMLHELLKRAGFTGEQIWDISFTTRAGPDIYWAFVRTRAA